MSTQGLKESAAEALMGFMREMNCWESEFFEKRQESLGGR